MSDDDLFFERGDNGGSDRSFREEKPIDFFRAYCERTNRDAASLRDGKRSSDIHTVVRQMKGLVREYVATAERVGAHLRPHFLGRVIEALHRESLGDPAPLEDLRGENATEQFLAESLYEELLEVPVLIRLSGVCNCKAFPSPKDWRVCLGLLTDSLPKITKTNSYAN